MGTLLLILLAAGALGLGATGINQANQNDWGGVTNAQKDFIDTYRSQNPDDDFIQGLTDDELLALLEPYEDKAGFFDLFTQGTDSSNYINEDEFLADIERLRNFEEERPEELNQQQIFSEAAGDINLDDAKARQLGQEEIGNLQQTYDTAKQSLLGNQAEQNRAILGQVGSEMDRSRQNAIEAGASAGLRLANNVNVLLSAQNKQRATSLDTANNLTQMLLNQQNQAMGIRQGINERESSRAQRTTGYQQQQYGQKQNIFNQELANWNRRYTDANRNVDPGLRDAYSSYLGNR
jgi:hypothetical protein